MKLARQLSREERDKLKQIADDTPPQKHIPLTRAERDELAEEMASQSGANR